MVMIWDSECSELVADATSRNCKAHTGSYILLNVAYGDKRWDYWQLIANGLIIKVEPEGLDAYI